MGDKARATNDHFVPQMYLRRWAVPRSGRGGHQLIAAPADNPRSEFPASTRNIGSEKGFYWGTTPEGVEHHHTEKFLSIIESEATTAFRALLDKDEGSPAADALPRPWPPRPAHRLAMSWWIAAQILRTPRQRERLWNLDGSPLDPPRSIASANHHIRYIAENVAPLAATIYRRAWGVGYSTPCLLTSDAPVQIMNAQDDSDQLRAASYWDIYLPLDPHRYLLIPIQRPQARDLTIDHKIDPNGAPITIPLNETVMETAHRHIFWHPDHDPRPRLDLDQVLAIRQQRPAAGGSQSTFSYATLHPDAGIERRWLHRHVPDHASSEHPGTERTTTDPTATAETMLNRLNTDIQRYRNTGRT
ncbi:DUF4238 domain-containing protein [Phytoactinopolyspora halotolerans]|uniref:DUF4238 domain-containing protein n=2 Tax=Phytoactinopolyspora halotolerans TaxID=1981512 RepID=A0A6L9S3X2_9ACTN|nr:DUF4238 domain-containing protein [Phytoactinopolyspora halotolerans]